MKNSCFVFVCVFVMLAACGCSTNKSRAVEGAIIGGLVGATAGGIVGHQSGHGGEGAGIGLAAGALTGALVGAQIAKEPKNDVGGPAVNQISMQQVVEMSKQGISDAVIIDRIKVSSSQFALNPDDIVSLRKEGVSDNVIAVMQGEE